MASTMPPVWPALRRAIGSAVAHWCATATDKVRGDANIARCKRSYTANRSWWQMSTLHGPWRP